MEEFDTTKSAANEAPMVSFSVSTLRLLEIMDMCLAILVAFVLYQAFRKKLDEFFRCR